MYVYIRSESSLWTVGHYDPTGQWHPDSDHGSPESAAQRTAWLNGSGSPASSVTTTITTEGDPVRSNSSNYPPGVTGNEPQITGEPCSSEPGPETSKREPLADQIYALFLNRLGSDWRRDITTTLRVDVIYWIIQLAEWGIEARRTAFKADKATQLAEAAASLASWIMNLEDWVNRIETAITPASKKPRKK